MSFKIYSKNQETPLKFFTNIKKTELLKNRKSDLRIFISTTHKEPNEQNHAKFVLNVSSICP